MTNVSDVLQAKTPGLTLVPGSGSPGNGCGSPYSRYELDQREQSSDQLCAFIALKIDNMGSGVRGMTISL